jgi:hypothetical protein
LLRLPDAPRPEGEKRPADVIGNAVHVMWIATGEIEEKAAAPKNEDAQISGRKGGQAQAEKTLQISIRFGTIT